MERSGNTAPKVDDVTSAAEETVQFDDDNLRGEKLKNIYIYLLSVINISEAEKIHSRVDTNI